MLIFVSVIALVTISN